MFGRRGLILYGFVVIRIVYSGQGVWSPRGGECARMRLQSGVVRDNGGLVLEESRV